MPIKFEDIKNKLSCEEKEFLVEDIINRIYELDTLINQNYADNEGHGIFVDRIDIIKLLRNYL